MAPGRASVENGCEVSPMTYDIRIEKRSEQPAAVIRGRVSLDEIREFLGTAFAEVGAELAAQRLAPVGPPFGQYRPQDGGFDIAAGFPTSGGLTPAGRVEPMVLPGGSLATTTHVGPYSEVSAAYEAVIEWLTSSGLVPAGDPWECYLDGPEVAEPRTVVYFPCREMRVGSDRPTRTDRTA